MTRFRPLASLIATGALLGGLLPGNSQAADATTQRVSVANDGSQATGGDSEEAAMSASGRYVAFVSKATNLVTSPATGGFVQAYVRDRLAGTTEMVSVSGSGAAGNGDTTGVRISSDGRFVAFETVADNLGATDAGGLTDVYLRDRQASTTELISRNPAGVAGNGASVLGDVADGGNLIVFSSDATDIVVPDGNAGKFDVFLRDRAAGATTIISRDSSGTQGNDSSGVIGPRISDNGGFAVFESSATNLVAGDGNGKVDVFVRDLANNTTERVSTSAGGGEGNDHSAPGTAPDISGAGRYVAFSSIATNLVPGDGNGKADVFRKDRQTGAIIRASQSSTGTEGNEDSGTALQGAPAINLDGRFVTFPSFADNLVAGDANGFVDVFVHDAASHETVRTNVSSEANGTSANPTISAASETAFDSGATNLVSGDSNGVFDVFARHFRKASGYFVLDDKGGIFTFGSASFKGSVPGLRNSGVAVGPANIVDLEVTPSGEGYYVLDDKGGIFTFGDAAFFGSVPGLRAADPSIGNAPVLDMAVTPSGQGYLILDQAGGIFTFGDATFHGSIPQLVNSGVQTGGAAGVDLSVTPSGRGYFILDDKGGIFTFGDAAFFGSVPGLKGAGAQIGDAPALRLAVTPSGQGYLVLDSAGGIFTFGDAEFFGSIPGLRASGVQIGSAEGVDLALTPTGKGYLILDDVGGIFTFGDGEFFGSVPALRNSGVIIGPNSSIRLDLDVSMVGG